jgi:hypothetical protein
MKFIAVGAGRGSVFASVCLGFLFVSSAFECVASAEQIKHGFLACGAETYIVDGDGRKSWTFPQATRDGYVLPNGKIVLAVNKSGEHPGGAVIEVTVGGGERVIWKGTQSEVNSVQPTDQGTYVITEAGPNPRLLEVDDAGSIVVAFPLACQKENHHMQTRMARKLSDDTYLVPHLLDFAVKQYDLGGKVLATFDTTVAGDPENRIHSWPFTAIRHAPDRTLVCCTHSNRVVEFDSSGAIVWELTNADLPGEWLQDPCGSQVLPNGNFVITSYAAGQRDPDAPKLFEVTRDKKVVWTYKDGKKNGVHHFQILDTNGKPLEGTPLK